MPRVMNPPTLRTNSPIEYGGVLNMMCNVTGRGVFYKTRTCVFDPATQEYLLQGDTYECEGSKASLLYLRTDIFNNLLKFISHMNLRVPVPRAQL